MAIRQSVSSSGSSLTINSASVNSCEGLKAVPFALARVFRVFIGMARTIVCAAKTSERSSCIRRSYSRLLKASLGRSWSLRDSTSARSLSFPGMWMILNLYLERIRDQRIWRSVSFRTVIKYSRFLWLVWISKPSTPLNSASHSSRQRMIANSSLSWIS